MVIMADIGGTKTILALASERGKTLRLLKVKRYENSRYASFDDILTDYLSGLSPDAETIIGVAAAGPVAGNICRMTNLSWIIDGKKLKQTHGFARVAILNDLEASGYGLDSLPDAAFETINAGSATAGNRVLISPGSGLGETIIHHTGERYVPMASEGGHKGFAPFDGTGIRLWEYARRSVVNVSAETFLCGPGLYMIYHFLAADNSLEPNPELEKVPVSERGVYITDLGLDKDDLPAGMTLRLFLDLLASDAGDLAVTAMASGGVYLGGGILPRLVPLIDRKRFMRIFAARGEHADLLATFPVRVVTDTNLPLYGMARYLLS